MILFLILLAINGLIVGALARLALPGRDPMTIPQTILVGIAGSFAGGLIASLVLTRGVSWFLSLVCATAIVYFIRRSRGGSLSDPGRPPLRR